MTQPTDHRLRQQYGGLQADEARRLTQLEKERAAQKACGGGGAGEGDALGAVSCEAVGSCCVVRRTLRWDGKLLSPKRRRRAVLVLQERYLASERRACRVVGQQHHQHGSRGSTPRRSLAYAMTKNVQPTLGPPGAYAPGDSSTRSCRMTTTNHFHQHRTNQGGHITLTPIALGPMPLPLSPCTSVAGAGPSRSPA